MPTLDDLPDEPSTEDDAGLDDEPLGGRSRRMQLVAVVLIIALGAPALVGFFMLFG